MDDMVLWARSIIRAMPNQAAIAIQFITESSTDSKSSSSTSLHLIHETAGPDGNVADSADVRLQIGESMLKKLLEGALFVSCCVATVLCDAECATPKR